MIPKIIHYIWLGGAPLPPLAERCIASWREHMPSWQIMRWDESNFDIAVAPLYVRQAYEARKYAFVSDYVRLWALEQYGGVYFDTDVQVLRPFEPLLGDTAFIGLEESLAHLPGTCVMGCEPHCNWVKEMLALYDNIHFILPDGSLDQTTNVQRMGEMIRDIVHLGAKACFIDYGVDAAYRPLVKSIHAAIRTYGIKTYTLNKHIPFRLIRNIWMNIRFRIDEHKRRQHEEEEISHVKGFSGHGSMDGFRIHKQFDAQRAERKRIHNERLAAIQ